MTKSNIITHTMRLNVNNEQHNRIHQILKDLNMDIHKSLNQFLIEAVDFYIKSFTESELTNQVLKQKTEEQEFITREDLLEIKEKLQSEVKDEIIRLLGIVITGGQVVNLKREETKVEVNSQEEMVMRELATKWG